MTEQGLTALYGATLTIDTDGTVVSGLTLRNSIGFAVVIRASHVTLQECDIAGAVNLFGPVHDIVIQNNYIHDVCPQGTPDYNKNFAGVTTTECAFEGNPLGQPDGAHHITIRGNYFENCPSGAFLSGCRGPIAFCGNYSANHRGPFPRGQMIQLARCDGTAGPIVIEDNFGYVYPEHADQQGHAITGTGAEDHINCYQCSGCEAHPILVRNNSLYGHSDSDSGSGIMLGDSGGSYYQIIGNKVYQTGNAGIGICGGHHLVVRGNRIHQNPPSPHYWSKGLQIVKFGDDFSAPVIVEDNLVYWQCGKGDGSLWCTQTELVVFRHNVFGSEDILQPLDPLPPHGPPLPVPGLRMPWMSAQENRLCVLS